jgi:hypothetical protein
VLASDYVVKINQLWQMKTAILIILSGILFSFSSFAQHEHHHPQKKDSVIA